MKNPRLVTRPGQLGFVRVTATSAPGGDIRNEQQSGMGRPLCA